jgi:hypothetical protein
MKFAVKLWEYPRGSLLDLDAKYLQLQKQSLDIIKTGTSILHYMFI